ncbi:hypothetical protein BDQ17DRAFT_1325821 [Cyathus striatus]|nr:hypothetical protein BDQ17DRAFT_1325821 [Cyathus striatus]
MNEDNCAYVQRSLGSSRSLISFGFHVVFTEPVVKLYMTFWSKRHNYNVFLEFVVLAVASYLVHYAMRPFCATSHSIHDERSEDPAEILKKCIREKELLRDEHSEHARSLNEKVATLEKEIAALKKMVVKVDEDKS